MLVLLSKKTDFETLKKASEDLDGYIKVVIDVKKKIMTVGGTRHVDGEQMLLSQGSHQEDLWGGGVDLETKAIDYDSMINIRPHQDNPSREVLSQDIRKIMDNLIKDFLLDL